jgi:hypothetical protein
MDRTRAIEDNGAEFLLALGRTAGAEERDDAVRWVIGNCPIDYHNAVVAADLSAGEADAVIGESLKRMRARGVPGTWHVGPSMRPADLGRRLSAAGFEYGGDDIGMSVDIQELPGRTPVPGGFAVERVRDEDGLAAWVETLGSGFGEGRSRRSGSGRCTAGLATTTGVRGAITSECSAENPWRPRPCFWAQGWPASTSSSPSKGRAGGASGRR